jgi:hypothetical protein
MHHIQYKERKTKLHFFGRFMLFGLNYKYVRRKRKGKKWFFKLVLKRLQEEGIRLDPLISTVFALALLKPTPIH